MRHAVFLCLMLIVACGETPVGRAVVKGAGQEDLLKLRAGPGLGFKVLMGLPDGTVVVRHGCVTELGQLWCDVSLADGPGVRGYVSADYLAGR